MMVFWVEILFCQHLTPSRKAQRAGISVCSCSPRTWEFPYLPRGTSSSTGIPGDEASSWLNICTRKLVASFKTGLTLYFFVLFVKSKLAMSQLSDGSLADHSKRSKLSPSCLRYRLSLAGSGEVSEVAI